MAKAVAHHKTSQTDYDKIKQCLNCKFVECVNCQSSNYGQYKRDRERRTKKGRGKNES